MPTYSSPPQTITAPNGLPQDIRVRGLGAGSVPGPWTGYVTETPQPGGQALLRGDLFMWPFSWDSIWNLPIHTGAVYGSTGMTELMFSESVDHVGPVFNYILKEHPSYPSRTIYKNFWSERIPNPETKYGQHSPALTARVPDNLLIPSSTSPNLGTLVDSLGNIRNMNPLHRGLVGGPVFAADFEAVANPPGSITLTSKGERGGGAARLSTMGGTIRDGEITGDPAKPIRHALKLNLHMARVGSKAVNTTFTAPGYRWPATGTHSYINDSTTQYGPRYGGTVIGMRLGSLLAIPPSDNLNLTGYSLVARKLYAALRDYGAYIVGDTGMDHGQVVVDHVEGQKLQASGMWTPAVGTELQTILLRTRLIENNFEATPGGGAIGSYTGFPQNSRRAPFAPVAA